MELDISCRIENIPVAIVDKKIFTTWGSQPDNMKAPSPPVGKKGLGLNEALRRGKGIGIFLGDGLCGIDLDGCRNPETGEISAWAFKLMEAFRSYTEISPSKTGLKILLLGAPELPRKQRVMEGEEGFGGKKAAIEVYSSGRYFTLTGDRIGDIVEIQEPPVELWERLNQFLAPGKTPPKSSAKGKPIKKGARNSQFYTMAISMYKKGFEYAAILAACQSVNQTSVDNPIEEKELEKIVSNACKVETEIPWVRNRHRKIEECQQNVLLALEVMSVDLSFNVFKDRKVIKRGDGVGHDVEDPDINGLWLDIEEEYDFRVGQGYFRSVCDWQARKKSFHPVKDWLEGLIWDKTERLQTWLKVYGKAEARENYLDWVSKAILVAAVSRVYEPGIKFDTVLVLQGTQGQSKSRALGVLAKKRDWFSDGLPLGADPKIVLEQTVGKWIIEAADLVEVRGNQIENLKAFLSRQSEMARKAYGYEATEKQRQFIIIGTTNDKEFLKDITGDRRFWPVSVGEFDYKKLEEDCDQLWAEAVELYKAGFSIEMPRELWSVAGEEQNERKMVMAWMEELEEVLQGKEGWLPAKDLRDWYLSRNWHDYVSYPTLTKYLSIRMNFTNQFARRGDSAQHMRFWWRGNKDIKIDLYGKPF